MRASFGVNYIEVWKLVSATEKKKKEEEDSTLYHTIWRKKKVRIV